MESRPDTTPLVVIVGETASGKSALALQLAKQFNGEIIAADSRTVYKGLDIGTAKPSVADQKLVRHHLIDIVTPYQIFTVADFKVRAQKAIKDIASCGKIPFLVGGSGLYIDAVLYDFSFRKSADKGLRSELSTLTVEQLQEKIRAQGIALPNNSRNPRHLIRALETNGAVADKQRLRPGTLILGLDVDREILRETIVTRVDDMVRQGFIEEVRTAAEKYGWSAPALQATGYKAFREYIEDLIDEKRAKEIFVRNDMQLAKRQRTWFRRNEDIHWICKKDEAVDLITTFLNKSTVA